jgi:hypothetical protein
MATTATPLQLQFDASVTRQQRQWAQDAIERSIFPMDRASMTITVKTVPEPPCAGHADYMCTQVDAGVSTIFIREGADDPTAAFNANVRGRLQDWFRESFIHEFGHAFCFNFMATSDADKTTIASWFRRAGAGEGFRAGALADWNPLDRPWEDRVQEALAEFFKDLYLPESARIYDQRTNWQMQRESFDAFMDMVELVICRADVIGDN